MASWPTRPDTGDSDHTTYSNVPTSPTPMDQLHPSRNSAISPVSNRPSYIPSPLNPNSSGASTGQRSRPPSFGGSNGLDRMVDGRPGGSSGSDGSGNVVTAHERDQIKGILSGSYGGGLGPYAPLRGPTMQQVPTPGNRFSTLSSVGSVISLTSDSKYPSMYLPNSNTQVTGGFFPYTDTPHIDYATTSFTPDEDDALHEPEPRGYKEGCSPWNWRGVLNLALLFIIVAALVTLFAAYPIINYVQTGASWSGNDAVVSSTKLRGEAATM